MAALLLGCGMAVAGSVMVFGPRSGAVVLASNHTGKDVILELFYAGGHDVNVRLRVPPHRDGQCGAARYELPPGRAVEHVFYEHDEYIPQSSPWEWLEAKPDELGRYVFDFTARVEGSMYFLEGAPTVAPDAPGCTPYALIVEMTS